MCLRNLKNSEPILAEQDIEVYKTIYAEARVVSGIDLELLHGKEYVAIVNSGNRNLKVIGKLTVEGGILYLCQNRKNLNGGTCMEKHGYRNSWCLDNDVKSIIVDNNEITGIGFKTIYQKATVVIGETYTSSLILESYGIISTDLKFRYVNVGLHSYANLEDAQWDLRENEILVKCIIPKGSTYYKGLFGIYESYASDALKYVEIIK